MSKLDPLGSAVASARLFIGHPWSSLALGAGLVTAMIGVFAGIGLLAAPWFLCELNALQIGWARGRPLSRGRAWLGASALQAAGALLVGSVLAMTIVGVGQDVLAAGTTGASPEPLYSEHTTLAITAAALLSVVLIVHFQYAPALLLERGGSVGLAVLESALLVRKTGLVRNWTASVLAHAVQFLPALLLLLLATRMNSSAQSLGTLALTLPVLLVCLPLGQGVVVSGYIEATPELARWPEVPEHLRPSAVGSLVWLAVLLALFAGPMLVTASLFRPAPLSSASHGGTPLFELDGAGKDAVRHGFLDSGLRVELRDGHALVVASDGGGAGTMPLPTGSSVRRVSAHALGKRYGLTLHGLDASGEPAVWRTEVDSAGVRQDDSLRRRLREALPGRHALWLLLSFAWAGGWLALVLPDHAQRTHARVLDWQAQAGDWRALRRRMRLDALRSALSLSPASCTSVWLGLSAMG